MLCRPDTRLPRMPHLISTSPWAGRAVAWNAWLSFHLNSSKTWGQPIWPGVICLYCWTKSGKFGIGLVWSLDIYTILHDFEYFTNFPFPYIIGDFVGFEATNPWNHHASRMSSSILNASTLAVSRTFCDTCEKNLLMISTPLSHEDSLFWLTRSDFYQREGGRNWYVLNIIKLWHMLEINQIRWNDSNLKHIDKSNVYKMLFFLRDSKATESKKQTTLQDANIWLEAWEQNFAHWVPMKLKEAEYQIYRAHLWNGKFRDFFSHPDTERTRKMLETILTSDFESIFLLTN